MALELWRTATLAFTPASLLGALSDLPSPPPKLVRRVTFASVLEPDFPTAVNVRELNPCGFKKRVCDSNVEVGTGVASVFITADRTAIMHLT